MKKFAFVVGIGAQTAGGLPPLRGAVTDANAIKSLLAGDDPEAPNIDRWEIYPVVATSTSEGVVGSRDALSFAFRTWLGQVKAAMDDETHVLVYFAGHAVRDLPTVGGKQGVSLMAIDTDWMSVATLAEKVLELGAHNTTVILDCCHAGGLTEEIRRLAYRGEAVGGLSVLAACNESQGAASYNEKGGEFTGLVLRGLGRDNRVGEGPVTAGRLGQYIKDHWGSLPEEVTMSQQPEVFSHMRDRPIPLVTVSGRQRSGGSYSGDPSASVMASNGPVLGPHGDIQVEQAGAQLRLAWVIRATGASAPWTAPVMISPGERVLAVVALFDRSGALVLVTGAHGTRVVRAQTDGTSSSGVLPGIEECTSAYFGTGNELGTVVITSRDGSTHKRDLVVWPL